MVTVTQQDIKDTFVKSPSVTEIIISNITEDLNQNVSLTFICVYNYD